MAESLLASGDLYVDRLADDGSSTGLVFTGNAVTLEIQANSEIKEQTGKGRTTYGQVIASVNLAQPHGLKVALNQLDKTTLAIAFLGEQTALSSEATSIADEVVAAKLDKYVEMSKRGLSAVVVTDSAGTTTYAAGTDYEVNPRLGMIKCLSTGAITEGQSLKVDATVAAEAGYKVLGATQPTVKMKLKLDGKNLVNGKTIIVTIWEAQVKPSSPVDFLADDFSALELEGTMVTPTGKTAPYQVEQID